MNKFERILSVGYDDAYCCSHYRSFRPRQNLLIDAIRVAETIALLKNPSKGSFAFCWTQIGLHNVHRVK